MKHYVCIRCGSNCSAEDGVIPTCKRNHDRKAMKEIKIKKQKTKKEVINGKNNTK